MRVRCRRFYSFLLLFIQMCIRQSLPQVICTSRIFLSRFLCLYTRVFRMRTRGLYALLLFVVHTWIMHMHMPRRIYLQLVVLFLLALFLVDASWQVSNLLLSLFLPGFAFIP